MTQKSSRQRHHVQKWVRTNFEILNNESTYNGRILSELRRETPTKITVKLIAVYSSDCSGRLAPSGGLSKNQSRFLQPLKRERALAFPFDNADELNWRCVEGHPKAVDRSKVKLAKFST